MCGRTKIKIFGIALVMSLVILVSCCNILRLNDNDEPKEERWVLGEGKLHKVHVDYAGSMSKHFISIRKCVALYYFKHGKYPQGDSSSISYAIIGDTPLAITDMVGDSGQFIDPWGNDLNIAIDDGSLRIHSAGPNGIVGDTDDIVQERRVNLSLYEDLQREIEKKGSTNES